MNIKEVKDLIHDVLQSDISEFELEHTGTRIRLKRGLGRDPEPAPRMLESAKVSSPPQGAEQTVADEAAAAESEDGGLHVISSPIVGTVYRSPAPDAEPYVRLGDQVEEGSTLCLVEAMKLMNEIPADIPGEVARIYIENGHPVEFGQRLFAIRPRRQG